MLRKPFCVKHSRDNKHRPPTWQPEEGEAVGASSPVTEVVHCTEGVASARQAAAGAVGEVSFLAVLALQSAVT